MNDINVFRLQNFPNKKCKQMKMSYVMVTRSFVEKRKKNENKSVHC